MARFYAEIEGNRGRASRMGSRDSGMWSHTRGWSLGAQVDWDEASGDDDRVEVRLTSGSGYGGFSSKPMFTARELKVGKKSRSVVEITLHFPTRRVFYINGYTGRKIRKPRNLEA